MSGQRFCVCHFLRSLWRGRNHFSGGSRNPALWFPWSSGSRYRDRFRAGTVPGAVRGGNARTTFARLIGNFTRSESNQNLEARKGLLFGLKRRPVNPTKVGPSGHAARLHRFSDVDGPRFARRPRDRTCRHWLQPQQSKESSDQVASNHRPEDLGPRAGLLKQPGSASARKQRTHSLGSVDDAIVRGCPGLAEQVACDGGEQRENLTPGKEEQARERDEPHRTPDQLKQRKDRDGFHAESDEHGVFTANMV